MQGTGKEPSAGQPVTYESVPDFEDFGLGAFLLAASEIYKRGLKCLTKSNLYSPRSYEVLFQALFLRDFVSSWQSYAVLYFT